MSKHEQTPLFTEKIKKPETSWKRLSEEEPEVNCRWFDDGGGEIWVKLKNNMSAIFLFDENGAFIEARPPISDFEGRPRGEVDNKEWNKAKEKALKMAREVDWQAEKEAK